MTEDRLTITIPEFAKAFGINRATAYRMAKDGTLPVIRVGKRILIPKVALQRWLEDAYQPKQK